MTDSPTSAPLEAKRSTALLYIVIGTAAAVLLGLVGMTVLSGSVAYYRTPTELLAEASSEQPAEVRLAGRLVVESVEHPSPGVTTFTITDGVNAIPVVYQGGATTALATAAKPGTRIVAEGHLDESDVFHAAALIAKCPSKYQTAKTSDQADS